MGLFNDLLGMPSPKKTKKYTGKKNSSGHKAIRLIGRQKRQELQRKLNKAKAKAKYSNKNRQAYHDLQRALQNS